MSFLTINPGKNPPEDINVVIEIPYHSGPVKYEVDKDSGMLWVDRFLSTPMYYPCSYGYVPQTLGEDGDPVDVLVVAPHTLLSGSVIRCRPVGMLQMTDEKGGDNKLLVVPVEQLSKLYSDVHKPEDLPLSLLESIVHFFEHYKDLEPDKWVKVDGWRDAKAAHQEINDSIARFQKESAVAA